MKVLIFQGFVDPEGRDGEALLEAWPTLPGVASGIAGAGARVEVVVAARRDEIIHAHGVRYRFVGERSRRSPRRLLGHRAAPHPRRSLRARTTPPPDVIHLHGLSFPLHARALRREYPEAALLAQDHADRPPWGWRRMIHRWGHAALDGVAFTSAALARPFVDTGVLPDGIQVFEVPEGSSDFSPGDRELQRRQWDMQAPTVAWVGNLVNGKNPMGALDAVARVTETVRGVQLRMVYRVGELEASVRLRIDTDPRLASRVRLVGPLPHPEMASFLGASDVLLTTSEHEGSGYTLIEALSCGTPAVASSIPAHRAVLGGGAAGILVPPGDTRATAAALARVIREGAARRRAARQRFLAALTYDVIGKKLLAAYEGLLEARVRGVPGGRP